MRDIISAFHWATQTETHDPVAKKCLKDLLRRLCEDTRHYHDYTHINNLLGLIDDLPSQWISDRPLEKSEFRVTLVLAALYHDAIYVPLGNMNEASSNQLFLSHVKELKLREKWGEEIVEAVSKAILLSTYENAKSKCPFGDFDLASLGGNWDSFSRNSKTIRAEFHAIPLKDYLRGRIQFLEKFAASEQIYFHPTLRSMWENQARKNIKREILNLQSLLKTGDEIFERENS